LSLRGPKFTSHEAEAHSGDVVVAKHKRQGKHAITHVTLLPPPRQRLLMASFADAASPGADRNNGCGWTNDEAKGVL
jgi:hypothetical protein